MGDAQVFVRTATYNADVAAFFTKWLVDVDDGQTPDGAFSDVQPNTMGASSVPAWADAGVICPGRSTRSMATRRILERHLPAMTRWVEWCRTHSTNLIRDKIAATTTATGSPSAPIRPRISSAPRFSPIRRTLWPSLRGRRQQRARRRIPSNSSRTSRRRSTSRYVRPTAGSTAIPNAATRWR